MHDTRGANFMLNYNMVMLACHYESVKVLNYLYYNVVKRSPNPIEMRKDLLRTVRETQSGIQAVHLACFFGNLEILTILHTKFKADFNVPTSAGLTGLHCAAQRLEGIVSIYYLKANQKGFNPDVADQFGATPLHYAIMNIEENNIQALLSLGADINQKDHQGNSPLHLAIVSYVDD